jgi:hypothetical protein
MMRTRRGGAVVVRAAEGVTLLSSERRFVPNYQEFARHCRLRIGCGWSPKPAREDFYYRGFFETKFPSSLNFYKLGFAKKFYENSSGM